MYLSGLYAKTQVTPTVTAAATNYTIGDSIGGKLTFSLVPDEGIISTVIVSDQGAEAKAMELWLFSAITATVTDNAAFDPADADLLNLIGIVSISSFFSASDNGVGIAAQCGMAYRLSPGATTLYGVLVDRAGGYVFDATSAVSVTAYIMR